jgi:protein arginine kinase
MENSNDLLDRLLATPARWTFAHGPDARVVHSTRVRLARNLASLPFPRRADAGILERLKNEARHVAAEAPLLKKMTLVDLDLLGPLDREFLVERHLISRDFAIGHGRLLVLDESENVAIMVNEEDHFRFQVLSSGMNAIEAWRVLSAIERDVDLLLDFAFRPPWGYLTSCPTNLGTGLRVSALCHLPGLARGQELPGVIQAANQVGIAVRGFYGEGSESIGDFYQFSNRASLGRTEVEFVADLESWVRQIIQREIAAREMILEKDRVAFEDRVWRARAILGAARVVSSQEMMGLLSIVRLGLDLGIIESPDLATINQLQILAQPAHLQKLERQALTPAERDTARARIIRERLT